MKTVIETKNLARVFGAGETRVTALDHVSITVKQGEFTAITGPSGSGKTTLLQLIGNDFRGSINWKTYLCRKYFTKKK